MDSSIVIAAFVAAKLTESQVVDLIQKWDLADASQRRRLLVAIFEGIETDSHDGAISLVVLQG